MRTVRYKKFLMLLARSDKQRYMYILNVRQIFSDNREVLQAYITLGTQPTRLSPPPSSCVYTAAYSFPFEINYFVMLIVNSTIS